MTEEEAIKRIILLQQDECDCEECRKDKEAYEIMLNLIEKKDKIIHLMARHIRNPKVIFKGGRGHQHIIEYFEKEEG